MSLYYHDGQVALHHGRALEVGRQLATGAANCIVTSPPYFGLRDYGVEGQYGLEESPGEYVEGMRVLFAELHRVLADDGTLWLNLGDSYAGSWGNQGHDPKHADLRVQYRAAQALPKSKRTGSVKIGGPRAKNLFGIPWRVAFALQDDGWEEFSGGRPRRARMFERVSAVHALLGERYRMQQVLCKQAGLEDSPVLFGQLLTEAVEVAKYPDVRDEIVCGGEEGGAGVGEPAAGRGDAEQRPEVGSRVAESGCGTVRVADEVDDLIVEIWCASTDLIPVGTPLIASGCGGSKRPAEGDIRSQRVIDGDVVPFIPQPLVEPPYQVVSRDRASHVPSSPFRGGLGSCGAGHPVRGVETSDEFTIRGAGGVEFFGALFELKAQIDNLLFKSGDLLVELVDVVGGADPGFPPGLLAKCGREAVFELLDPCGQSGCSLLSVEQIGLQRGSAHTARRQLVGGLGCGSVDLFEQVAVAIEEAAIHASGLGDRADSDLVLAGVRVGECFEHALAPTQGVGASTGGHGSRTGAGR